MPAPNLPLGQPVRCTAKVKRVEFRNEEDKERFQAEWRTEPCTPFHGIYIGYRYKQNGYRLWYSTTFTWKPESTCLVALVVVDATKNTITVPFTHLTPIESLPSQNETAP